MAEDTAADRRATRRAAGTSGGRPTSAGAGGSIFDEDVDPGPSEMDLLRDEIGTDIEGLNERLRGIDLSRVDPGALSQLLGGIADTTGGRLEGASEALGGIAETTGGRLDMATGMLLGQATGGMDPAFADFRSTQMDLLGRQRAQEMERTAAGLRRQGLTGTIAQNEQTRLGQQFDAREADLSSQIGVQSLQRRDAALRDFAGTALQGGQFQSGLAQAQGQLALQGGQFRAGLAQSGAQDQLARTAFNNQQTLQEAELDASASQNLMELLGLDISEIAAENAGQGGGGGGGSSCALICLVLTDELMRTGELDTAQFLGNARYAARFHDPDTYAGYRAWADPLVGMMRRRPRVRSAVRWAVDHYTRHTAHAVGQKGVADSRTGAAIERILWPLSKSLGTILRHGRSGSAAAWREQHTARMKALSGA